MSRAATATKPQTTKTRLGSAKRIRHRDRGQRHRHLPRGTRRRSTSTLHGDAPRGGSAVGNHDSDTGRFTISGVFGSSSERSKRNRAVDPATDNDGPEMVAEPFETSRAANGVQGVVVENVANETLIDALRNGRPTVGNRVARSYINRTLRPYGFEVNGEPTADD